MAQGRGKPKGKGKGKKGRNEWALEGGAAAVEDAQRNPEGVRPKKRVTQEQWERQRRRKRRLEDIHRKDGIKRKLAKGFRANLVFDNEEQESEEEAQPKKVRIKKEPLPVSSVPLMQRLIRAVKGRRAEHDESDDESSEENHDIEAEGADSSDEDNHRDGTVEASNGTASQPSNNEDVFALLFGSSKLEDSPARADATSRGSFRDRFEVISNGEALRIRSLGDIPHLHKTWRDRAGERAEGLQRLLLPYLCSYNDILVEGRTHKVETALLDPILLHLASHLVRARFAVIKHNTKLRTAQALEKAGDSDAEEEEDKEEEPEREHEDSDPTEKEIADTLDVSEDENDEDRYRDQGFTRPRVLILCGMRKAALSLIEQFLETFGPLTSISGLERFRGDFGVAEEAAGDDEAGAGDDEDDANERTAEAKDGASGLGELPTVRDANKGTAVRPPDWNAIFDGNTGDDFRIGLQVTPGQGKGKGANKGVFVKLYSEFFHSDIILASPLGLKLAVESNRELNYDFLSSIEIVLAHQCDVMLMQNPDHLVEILKRVNGMPESSQNTDFSRVREYFLDGKAAAHRQLVMTTWFQDPMLNSIFRQNAQSLMGQTRVKKIWAGSIAALKVQVQQVFQLVPCNSPADQDDARFSYFCDSVLPQLLRLEQKHTVIYASSYFEFVRLRNELIRRKASAVFISEYSRQSEISRGRSRFYHGQRDILLYSGRAHFYMRYRIRGAKHIIFYSLPEYPHFYPEMVNVLEESANAQTSCLALYTRFNKFELERIVGQDRGEHMLTSNKSTFLFS